jgi:hypothetical protein
MSFKLTITLFALLAAEPVVADDFNYTYYTDQHPGDKHHEEGWVAVCKRHCHIDGGSGIHGGMINACGAYVHEMPKPNV